MKKRIAIPLIIAAAAAGYIAGLDYFGERKTIGPESFRITFGKKVGSARYWRSEAMYFATRLDTFMIALDKLDPHTEPFENEYADELIAKYNQLVESKNKVIGIAKEQIKENKELTRQRNYWHDVANATPSTPATKEPPQPTLAEQNLMLLDEQNYLIHQQNMILDDIYHNSF